MAACIKVRYPSLRRARLALRYLRTRGMRYAYQCPRCYGWHVTHGRD